MLMLTGKFFYQKIIPNIKNLRHCPQWRLRIEFEEEMGVRIIGAEALIQSVLCFVVQTKTL